MIENGCCFMHFGVWRKLAYLVGIWEGGRGADVQRQLNEVVRNKLIYQWIATALRVRSYVEAICPEDEKPSAEIQKGYKHA